MDTTGVLIESNKKAKKVKNEFEFDLEEENSALRKSELQLLKREKLFTLLTDLTRKLFLHPDWNKALVNAFEEIGKITEVDRVYLFKMDEVEEGQAPSVSQLIEWNSGTSEPQLNNPNLQQMVLTEYQPIIDVLQQRKAVSMLVKAMDNKSLQAILIEQEIQSFVIFPIHVKSEFWGFIGFDQCTHERLWTDIELSVLESFSTTLAGSIEKHEAETEKDEWKTKHELILNASGQIIYDLDISSGKIQWSGSVTSELGYSPDEMGGIDAWIERIHPDDRGGVLAKYKGARKSLSKLDAYYRIRNKEGKYNNIHDKGHFIGDHTGLARRMLGVMINVTERVQQEVEKREIENAYNILFDNTPDAIIITTTDIPSRIISANKAAAKMHGYELEDFNNLLVHDLKSSSFSNMLNERLESLLKGERSSVESLHKRKDGSVFPVMVVSGVINVRGNKYVMSIYRDISDVKDTQNKLHESLSLLTATLESTADGIVVINQHGKITASNKKFFKLWNITPDLEAELDNELFTQHVYSMIENIDAYKKRIDYLQEHPTEKGEDLIYLLDGRVFHRYSKPQRIGNTVVGRVWSFRDISARIQYERSLEESQARFKRLQEASFGGICIHKNDVIIDSNHGLSVITGYSPEELRGIGLEKLVAPEYVELIRKHIKESYDQPYDIEGICKDGTRCFLEVQGKNIPYRGQTVRVTEFRDISKRKQAEQIILQEKTRIQSIAQNLTRKNEQLEEFTQIVSHNLRSPVGNISSLLSLHNQADNEEEKSEMLKLLKQTSDSLLTTLHELNEVLKIKQNENMERQDINFADVLNHVLRMCHAKVIESSAVVTSDFDDAPVINYANIYLESILLNLLSNAIKYRKSGVAPQIHFKSEHSNGCTVLKVSDNGRGINLNKYGHQVFKMRKTFHDHPDSRGIGLFMVKNQVESMGGEITIESTENVGTSFIINLNKNLQ